MSPTCPALQPFKTRVLSLGDSTLLGSLNLGPPAVTYSPLLPWSGPGPVGGQVQWRGVREKPLLLPVAVSPYESSHLSAQPPW